MSALVLPCRLNKESSSSSSLCLCGCCWYGPCWDDRRPMQSIQYNAGIQSAQHTYVGAVESVSHPPLPASWRAPRPCEAALPQMLVLVALDVPNMHKAHHCCSVSTVGEEALEALAQQQQQQQVLVQVLGVAHCSWDPTCQAKSQRCFQHDHSEIEEPLLSLLRLYLERLPSKCKRFQASLVAQQALVQLLLLSVVVLVVMMALLEIHVLPAPLRPPWSQALAPLEQLPWYEECPQRLLLVEVCPVGLALILSLVQQQCLTWSGLVVKKGKREKGNISFFYASHGKRWIRRPNGC